MAMLRQARRDGRADLLRVLVSARSPADLYYADELPGRSGSCGPARRRRATREDPAG